MSFQPLTSCCVHQGLLSCALEVIATRFMCLVCMQEVARICNVTAMPTFQVWKNKACVDTLVGANLEKLTGLIGKHKGA